MARRICFLCVPSIPSSSAEHRRAGSLTNASPNAPAVLHLPAARPVLPCVLVPPYPCNGGRHTIDVNRSSFGCSVYVFDARYLPLQDLMLTVVVVWRMHAFNKYPTLALLSSSPLTHGAQLHVCEPRLQLRTSLLETFQICPLASPKAGRQHPVQEILGGC